MWEDMILFDADNPYFLELPRETAALLADWSTRILRAYAARTGIPPCVLLSGMTSRRVAAIHEAAHAVVAAALGIHPTAIRIWRDPAQGDAWGGCCQCAPLCGEAERFCLHLATLGGHLGERILLGIKESTSSLPEATRGAYNAKVMLAACSRNQAIDVWRMAAEIIEAEKFLLLRVGQELAKRERLEGEDLRVFFRGLPARWRHSRVWIDKAFAPSPPPAPRAKTRQPRKPKRPRKRGCRVHEPMGVKEAIAAVRARRAGPF